MRERLGFAVTSRLAFLEERVSALTATVNEGLVCVGGLSLDVFCPCVDGLFGLVYTFCVSLFIYFCFACSTLSLHMLLFHWLSNLPLFRPTQVTHGTFDWPTVFLLKDALALIYQSTQLREEAVRHYEELDVRRSFIFLFLFSAYTLWLLSASPPFEHVV
jgi:hypothetical protein